MHMTKALKSPMADPLCFRGKGPWDDCYALEKAADIAIHFASASLVLKGHGDSSDVCVTI